MKKVKYIRVSTTDQNTARQGSSEYVDRCSGSIPLSQREAGSRLLEEVNKGLIDTIQVHSIDRLGRSTIDILQTIEYLTSKGVNVISEKEGLQTLINGKTNPTAKLVLGVMATLAEFERANIRERQREGIREAQKRGEWGERKRKAEDVETFLNKPQISQVVKKLKNGGSLSDCQTVRVKGQPVLVSRPTVIKVKKILKAQGDL